MRDRTAISENRHALEAFLKEAGFASLGEGGDALLLEPCSSETREVRRSEKSVVATISTRARDRHGDIIKPSGARLDRFRKNPVVLYAHDYAGLPVAKSLWEKVVETDDDVELVAKPQFHCNTELSREVWTLVRKGVLSAWSVGFIPEAWEPGPDGKGFRVTKWDLLEYSCVPVPANFQALTRELKSRRITAPALVKSLSAAGLEAPDLVEHDVRQRANHQDTKDTKEDNDESGERLSERHQLPGRAVPGALGVLGGGDVRTAVGRAFERVIERARGGV